MLNSCNKDCSCVYCGPKDGEKVTFVLPTQHKHEPKPHKCPVCNGTGKNSDVTTSYGAISHYIEQCLACKGACVLWG